MKALVTGATGFVGRHLLTLLDEPHILSRDKDRAARETGCEAFSWSPGERVPTDAFEGVDAVIHLAGESVADGRWSAEKKRRIMDSRREGTRSLVESIAALESKPKVLVSASAVGIYGSRGDELLTESSSPAKDDFLAEVCQAWEQEARKAEDAGLRVVCVRIGIVLGADGGALSRMLLPFKMGVGGTLGFKGDQYMPWIHRDDLCRLLLFAAERDDCPSIVNGAAPKPVTNKVFTKALGAALHRPTLFPVPYLALRVALGGFADVLFDSQRVVPEAAQKAGFEFHYDEIQACLEAVLNGAAAPEKAPAKASA